MTDDDKFLHRNPNDVEHEAALLRARLESAEAWIATANEWIRAATEMTREAQMRADSATLWAHRSALRVQAVEQQAQAETAELRQQQRDAEQRYQHLAAYVNALTSSVSWRVSVPIRVASRFVRGVLRAFRYARRYIRRYNEYQGTPVAAGGSVQGAGRPATGAGNAEAEPLMAPVANAQQVLFYAECLRKSVECQGKTG